MRSSYRRLADGRRIAYYDAGSSGLRAEVDRRDLAAYWPRPERRRDPLTGQWVAIAEHRQDRTYKPAAGFCPLCPSTPDCATEIPEPDYQVAVFENRFPAFASPPDGRNCEGSPLAELAGEHGIDVVPRAGGGRCEVVCFTSDHGGSFAELGRDRAELVVAALADRTEQMMRETSVRAVFCFENRGEDIGVTLHHPHGQIYGFPFVPPRTQRLADTAARHIAETGRHVMADLLAAEHAAGERVLLRGDHWSVLVPPAARWPVEVLLVPHRRMSVLGELTDAERTEFAELYLRLLRALDRLYGTPLPYIASWQQGARGQEQLAWLHHQVFSVQRSADRLKYLAGAESGAEVWINDVNPERMAERLRRQL